MRTLFSVVPFQRSLGQSLGDPREALARLSQLRSRLQAERAADAETFREMSQKGRERYELLSAVGRAEEALRAEERTWEATHRNFEALEVARQALANAQAVHDNAKAELEALRRRVDDHAAAIARIWANVEAEIAALPAELQAEARDMMAVCMAPALGSGESCGLHGQIGCKKCQKGKKRRPPYDPFKPQMLGQVRLAQGPAKESPTTAVPGSKPGEGAAQAARIEDLMARVGKIHAYVRENPKEAQDNGTAALAAELPATGNIQDYPKLLGIYNDLKSGKTVPAADMKCVEALEDAVEAIERKRGLLGKATPWVVGGSVAALVAGVAYGLMKK